MELDELKTLWQGYDSILEKTLKVNLQTLDLIQHQKVQSLLKPLYLQRVIELAFHSCAIILLSIFCYYNYDQIPYALSGYMLIVFYSVVFRNCLYQVRLLSNIRSEKDVVSIQCSLAKSKANSLHFLRLSVLFIPALLSFAVVIPKAIRDLKLNSFLNFDIIKQTNGSWWTAQVIVFIILIPLGIWFYQKVNYKNVHKKWVKNLIEKVSGKRVKKTVEYISELELLKRGV